MGLKVLQASFVGLVAIAKIDTSLELPELRQKLRLIAAVVDAPCVTVVQDKHVEEIGPNARKSVDFSSVYDIVGKRIVR